MQEQNFITWLQSELEQNGLFEEQTQDILEIINNDPDFMPEFTSRWHEPVSAYPPMMKNLVWLNVKPLVLKYIDEKCPKAWFRPMFLPLDEQEAFMASQDA